MIEIERRIMLSLFKQHWAKMSIHYKAVTLCCTFVVPILVTVGILIFEFSFYRVETDRILSEYANSIDYAIAVRSRNIFLTILLRVALTQMFILIYSSKVLT